MQNGGRIYQYFRDLNRCPEISYKINLALDNDIATGRNAVGRFEQDLNKTLNKHPHYSGWFSLSKQEEKTLY